MPKFLLAFMLTVGVSRADQPADRVTPTWEKVGVVASRVFGRLLGSLIENGMTSQQVAAILGSSDARGLTFVGASCLGFQSYLRLGVWVDLESDTMGVLRVSKVTFWPLLD